MQKYSSCYFESRGKFRRYEQIDRKSRDQVTESFVITGWYNVCRRILRVAALNAIPKNQCNTKHKKTTHAPRAYEVLPGRTPVNSLPKKESPGNLVAIRASKPPRSATSSVLPEHSARGPVSTQTPSCLNVHSAQLHAELHTATPHTCLQKEVPCHLRHPPSAATSSLPALQ